MQPVELQGKKFSMLAAIPPHHSRSSVTALTLTRARSSSPSTFAHPLSVARRVVFVSFSLCVLSVVIDVFAAVAPPVCPRDLGIHLQELESDLLESNNHYHGSQLLIERVNQVLNYDRAVMYKCWLPDMHCETIAEERRIQEHYPFLGLKFPPQSAEERAAYVDLRVRIISDATSHPSTVIGSFDPNLKPYTVKSPGGSITTVFADLTAQGKTSKEAATAVAAAVAAGGGASTITVPPETKDAPTGPTPTHVKSASSTVPAGSPPPFPLPPDRPRSAPPSAEYDLNLSGSLLRCSTPFYLNLLRSLGIRASMTLAVVVGEQLHGVLAFYSVTNNTPQWSVTPSNKRTSKLEGDEERRAANHEWASSHPSCFRFCCAPFFAVRTWESHQFLRAAECIFSRWIRMQERQTRQLQTGQLAEMGERIKKTIQHKIQHEPNEVIPLLMSAHTIQQWPKLQASLFFPFLLSLCVCFFRASGSVIPTCARSLVPIRLPSCATMTGCAWALCRHSPGCSSSPPGWPRKRATSATAPMCEDGWRPKCGPR